MQNLSAKQRILLSRFAHVSLPDYVLDCEPWESDDDSGWIRLFTVREWMVGTVLVAVSGEQSHTGEVTLWLYVGGEEQFSNNDQPSLVRAMVQAGQLLNSLS